MSACSANCVSRICGEPYCEVIFYKTKKVDGEPHSTLYGRAATMVE